MTDRLNFGARIKREGWMSVDFDPDLEPDILADLTEYPWPFRTSQFEHIQMHQVIEHLPDHLSALNELHRIAKPGAHLSISGPHWNAPTAWSNPNHYRPFHHRELVKAPVAGKFRIDAIEVSKVRHGRLLPDRLALALADHFSYLVGSVRVEATVLKDGAPSNHRE